jgi:putative transcriptional regulator
MRLQCLVLNTKTQIFRRSAAVALVAGLVLIYFCTGMGPIGAPASYVRATGLLSSVKPVTSSRGSGYRTENTPSRGKFLVAARGIRDPRFAEAVILLIEYGPRGAMGLVINRPSRVKLSRVLPEIKGLRQRADTLYFGGPVNTNQIILLIRSRSLPKDSVHVFENIYASSSLSELQSLTEDPSPGEKFHAYAGYAGWGPGQLDREVSRGDWHLLRADSGSVLDKKPSDIWPELIGKISGMWV